MMNLFSSSFTSDWSLLLWMLWPLEFVCWLLIWSPAVALLEYAAHRWIMHKANSTLDPDLCQLKAHGKHHQGDNGLDFVDVPLRNTLRLTAPLFLIVLLCGLMAGQAANTLLPTAALFAWTVLYVYLWNRMHRAIHGVETNWFRHSGPLYRFYRRHHLRHHHQPRTNFGTVFPITDYVFFTWATTRHRVRTVELMASAACAEDGAV
jgi:hypothetical protein